MSRPDPHLLAASLAHTIRPDWPLGSVRAFLTETYPAETHERLAVAAVLVALDPTAQTPAALRNGGRRYWLDLDGGAAGQPLPPPAGAVLAERPEHVPPPPDLRDRVAEARQTHRETLAGRVYHQPEGADT